MPTVLYPTLEKQMKGSRLVLFLKPRPRKKNDDLGFMVNLRSRTAHQLAALLLVVQSKRCKIRRKQCIFSNLSSLVVFFSAGSTTWHNLCATWSFPSLVWVFDLLTSYHYGTAKMWLANHCSPGNPPCYGWQRPCTFFSYTATGGDETGKDGNKQIRCTNEKIKISDESTTWGVGGWGRVVPVSHHI